MRDLPLQEVGNAVVFLLESQISAPEVEVVREASRPFVRCAYSLLKRPKSHYLHPPGRAVSYLYTGSIAIQLMKRGCQKFPMYLYLVDGHTRRAQGLYGAV